MLTERSAAGLPESFREALERNGKAVIWWEAMTDEERAQHLHAVSALRGPQEMEAYVDNLVGWEIGHPPYQL